MCTGMSGARGALLACNIVLMVIALAFMAGGVVLIIGRGAYENELDDLKDDVSVTAAAMGNGNLDVSALDIEFITKPLGITLLVAGLLIATICILGLIAASGEFYKFVIVYAVLLGCLYFSQIVVIICAYADRDTFDNTVKDYLKAELKDYTDKDGEDSFTLGWNAVMNKFECCGVDDYTDFSVAGYPKGNQVTPRFCCIDKITPSPNCANNVNYQTDTYYNRGCYPHMWDYVTTDSVLFIVAVFAIVLLEFLCLFFATWIICCRQSYGHSKVWDYDNYPRDTYRQYR